MRLVKLDITGHLTMVLEKNLKPDSKVVGYFDGKGMVYFSSEASPDGYPSMHKQLLYKDVLDQGLWPIKHNVKK